MKTVVEYFDLFYYDCVAVRLTVSQGYIDDIRRCYYQLEQTKHMFDRAVYQWMSVRDWRTSEPEAGAILLKQSFEVTRENLAIQEVFRSFVFSHQEEAFPVAQQQRVLTRYEQMLFDYYKSHKNKAATA